MSRMLAGYVKCFLYTIQLLRIISGVHELARTASYTAHALARVRNRLRDTTGFGRITGFSSFSKSWLYIRP